MVWTPMAGSAFGAHDSYEWLVTEHALEDVLSICPDLVVGKYLAITAADSGPLVPNSEQVAGGWMNAGGIAYSPKITSLKDLQPEGWDEWFVFENKVNLGRIADGSNIFESPIKQEEVRRFVNYNLGLHRAEINSLATLFWKQIETIQPQVYIADSDYHLSIVSSDRALFGAARKAINKLDSQANEQA